MAVGPGVGMDVFAMPSAFKGYGARPRCAARLASRRTCHAACSMAGRDWPWRRPTTTLAPLARCCKKQKKNGRLLFPLFPGRVDTSQGTRMHIYVNTRKYKQVVVRTPYMYIYSGRRDVTLAGIGGRRERTKGGEENGDQDGCRPGSGRISSDDAACAPRGVQPSSCCSPYDTCIGT